MPRPKMVIFDEVAYHNEELLVQGSTEFTAKGMQLSIPAIVNLTAHTIKEVWDGSYIHDDRCIIERAYAPITCHVCEGGHHIHAKWTSHA